LAPTYASYLKLEKGVILFYKYARMSSGFEGQEIGHTSFEILTLNQTALFFRVNATNSSEFKIEYKDGIPTYTDRLEALIYLPPECIDQSLKGNLEWTTQIETLTQATVAYKASHTLDFPVEAGTFQSINITLNLVGWEWGTLTLIYDVNSGILIYEDWIHGQGGDIIVHVLIAIKYTPGTRESIINLIFSVATLATPVTIAIQQTHKRFKRRSHRSQKQPKDIEIGNKFPKKSFYAILSGASLNLASIFLPWGEIAGSQIYLPLSLPSALTASTSLPTSTSTLITIGLIVHLTAILTWLTMATFIYTSKWLASQLVAIVSSILVFVSALLFTQTGWAPSWGLPIALIGAILIAAGAAIIRQKTKTSLERQNVGRHFHS